MTPRLLFDGAIAAYQGGDPGQAERLCLQLLALEPSSAMALHLLGLVQYQQGRLDEALARFEKALAIKPDYAEAWNNRGSALRGLSRTIEALESFGKALAIRPDYAGALNNRGLALADVKRFEEALMSFDRALALQPRDAAALYNRAITLRCLNRFAEALADFDAVLTLTPGDGEALAGRGICLCDLGRFDEALTNFDHALALAPNDAAALNNRGTALRGLNRAQDALADYGRALALKPNFAAALYNRALALCDLNRFAEALAAFDQALKHAPAHAEALYNRGGALYALNRFDEALACYDQALILKPDFAKAFSSRASLQWFQFGRLESAIGDLEKLLAVDPDHDYARGELLHLRMYGADWRDFEAQTALLDLGVRAGKKTVTPFIYQSISQSPADLQACALIYAADRYPPAPMARTRRSHAKLRVGYVSGEFRDQATASLMAGLYEAHDKSRFEIIAFDNGQSDNSLMRRRLEAAFDKFIDIRTLPDRAAADVIAAEGINILVNLNGYFGQTRMGVFAHRPAPIQVNFLGFPGTLGADYIDYILADRIVIPDEERRFYTEKVVYLPDSYQINDDKRPIAQNISARQEHGLPPDGFVFCNFNQGYKLTPAMFAVWMRILKQTNGSVLWLLQGGAAFAENLRRTAQAQGVAGERLIFASHIPADQHLARLGLADLFLDSLPCNAHTTASDALWAGLPLLTCRGTAFAGRVAASLLLAIDLRELVSENLGGYEALALRLAGDAALLKSLRQKLAHNRKAVPLFDTDRFRRNLEAAYLEMWNSA